MDNPTKTEDPNSDASRHDRLRATLRARYRLAGEYVGAPAVATILGLGRTTVHDQVKSNRFPIPHRVVGRKPIFSLDDLVAWMLGREWPRESIQEPPAASARRVDRPGTSFKHPDARDAFLRMCERRGLPVP